MEIRTIKQFIQYRISGKYYNYKMNTISLPSLPINDTVSLP